MKKYHLLEIAVHAAIKPILAKYAFTLAEVLITLGIIGVVAAMTIPTLIANTNGAKYRSQFKKTVSTLSQAARLSQSLYGFDFAGINNVCGANAATEHPDNVMTMCSLLNGTLTGATYVKLGELKLKKGNTEYSYSDTVNSTFTSSTIYSLKNLSAAHAYLLADGSLVVFSPLLGANGCSLSIGKSLNKDSYGNEEMASCAGFIDVNGVSLPNKEVNCSSGNNALSENTCIVKNDAQHLTDIYPVRFHDGIVEAATAAARYVLKTAK